jgi:NAD(P)-dependent dehydrogenase (short-subunit alcohol dehydrogenase family)
MAGPFMTDMSKHWDLDAFAAYAKRMPAGRGGQPSEISGAAVFLAGPWSSYVTGAFLAVDGGMTLVRE